jgi:uncharacterized repeat protein (TIGR01451 family)
MTTCHRFACAFLSILSVAIATSAFAVSASSPVFTFQESSDSKFSVGSSTLISFHVANVGTATATGLTLSATLSAPTGIVWTLSNGPSSCNLSGVSGGTQTLQCGPQDLPPLASIAFTVSTTPTALACETLNFAVNVTADNAIGGSFGDSVVVDCPALSVSKRADSASVAAGNPIGFTIGAVNNQNGLGTIVTATGVSLTDSLPATGATWAITSDSTSKCSISGPITAQSLSCPIGDMAPGSSATIHVASTPTICGQFSNTAIASPTNAGAVSSPQASTTVPCGSLDVVTAPDSTPISADDTAGFTTTVSVSSGIGPNATNVMLSQPLPGGAGTNWQVDSSSQAAADCAISGSSGAQTLSCTLGSIAPGGSAAVHVTSPTTSGTCQSYSTTATASANNYGSSTSSANLVVECPALSLTKTADTASVSAGGTIGFGLLIFNSNQTGTGVAYNPTFTDPLPTGTGLDWMLTVPIAGCSIAGTPPSQTLSCSIAKLNPGAGLQVNVQSSTDASACGTQSNTATLAADNAPSQNASASTMVLCPALQVSKTADNATVSAGDQIGYIVSVMNSAAGGTGDATAVTITDTLPANSGLNWTIVSPPSGCSISSGVLSCSIDDLPPGGSAAVHVTSPTDQTTCGTVSNTAAVSAANSSTVAPSSTAAISVNCPTLGLMNLADAASVNAGQPIGYTLTATNSGAGTAHNVALSEALPGAGGLDWTISPAYTMPGSCGINGSPGAQTLTCAFGDLATGASAMVHVTSNTGGGACGAESPTATLSADNASTLTQGATTTVLCPQLQVTKLPTSSSASADDAIGFAVSVTNGGAGIADGVILTDPLPTDPGLSWSISGPNPSGCTISAGVLTCNIGSLNPGGSASVNISSPTTPATCGDVDNTAAATTTNGVPARSSAGVTVGCPDLMVTKTPATNPLDAGQNAVFNIVVNNLGSGIARGATLKDALPTGINWSDDSKACKIAAGVMTCNFGDLAAGQTQTVHVTGATSSRLCAPLTNTATVAATNEDAANLANNGSTATININCQADLSIIKLPLLLRVSKGSLQSYLIGVFNAGPHPAQGVVISDPTPTGTVFAALVAGGSCTKPAVGAAGPLRCQIPTLPVGGLWLGALTLKVTAAPHSTITNKATVTGTTVDPNPGNNTSTVSTPVF